MIVIVTDANVLMRVTADFIYESVDKVNSSNRLDRYVPHVQIGCRKYKRKLYVHTAC